MKSGWSSEYTISKNSPSYASRGEFDSISDIDYQAEGLRRGCWSCYCCCCCFICRYRFAIAASWLLPLLGAAVWLLLLMRIVDVATVPLLPLPLLLCHCCCCCCAATHCCCYWMLLRLLLLLLCVATGVTVVEQRCWEKKKRLKRGRRRWRGATHMQEGNNSF